MFSSHLRRIGNAWRTDDQIRFYRSRHRFSRRTRPFQKTTRLKISSYHCHAGLEPASSLKTGFPIKTFGNDKWKALNQFQAAKKEFNQLKEQLNELLEQKKYAEALAFFLEGIGIPREVIDGMFRQSPQWNSMLKIAPTLATGSFYIQKLR